MTKGKTSGAKAPEQKASRKVSEKAGGREQAQRIVSVPADFVYAPQVEVPRQLTGRDQSRQKTSVQELTWADFDRHVQGLARSVQAVFKPQAVVGVAHGGVFVGGALSSALGCEFFPVRISRRSRDKAVRKQPRLAGEMPAELAGKRVLVVDDVASSGDTLELAVELARKVGAKETRTAVMVARPGGFAPDHHALSTQGLVVFPWDYEQVSEDARFDVDPDKAGA
ncbi:phosphoribosyl transferase [Aggregicoccus sp. 17bor-14]|nr:MULTISPECIES: phosphoribosyltransferase [Myxococcaceae]MBF5045051.1 phosphoribosyltransferase domain-containing protein [Simulacricoccus sp. 17bor-14]MRI90793.1 phosphoribosyl transferase [Aggregicoccus sp. 17bor-14]